MPLSEVMIASMQNTAVRITQAAEYFRNAAQEFINSARQLSGCWEGDSQAAFLDELEQADQLCKNMMTAADTYVKSLNNTVKAYMMVGEDVIHSIRNR